MKRRPSACKHFNGNSKVANQVASPGNQVSLGKEKNKKGHETTYLVVAIAFFVTLFYSPLWDQLSTIASLFMLVSNICIYICFRAVLNFHLVGAKLKEY
jgi:hypothetical protein